jgi:hypothetical protein
MARRLTLRDILDRMEPRARDAFIAAIRLMATDFRMADFLNALERRDAEAALAALGLDAAYFEPLDAVLREAVREGGAYAFEEVAAQARGAGARVVGVWGATNPRAERLLRERSSSRIVEITEDVRATVRETLATAMQTDASPRVVARLVVGSFNRTSQRREGGIVGLTSQAAGYVANARAELESGDPARMAAYLERKARDRRFDPTVRRAIREGRPVAAADVDRMVGRYADRLLALRGVTIGRTEVLGSLHAGQDEGLSQLVERGEIADDAITLVWWATTDRDVRDSHLALHKQTRKRGQPFVSPISGAMMLFPGDRSLGAPAAELISCRCHLRPELDTIRGLRSRLTPEELAATRAAILAEG